ncbi:MAG: signal peptidase I [bacterium]|nr:signal peptidase I [bacterium]
MEEKTIGQNPTEQAPQEEGGGWGAEAFEFFKVLIVAVAVALPIRYFIAQPFIVNGASMDPTFEDGQYLIIDEASYYFFRAPERGEVVVFRYPLQPKQFFIKRVIGLPNERVEIRNGEVWIKNDEQPNGFVLPEPYLPEGLRTNGDTEVKLSDKEYFVMGDNREFSSDSRRWGTLDRRFITGRALIRAWPLSKIGVVSD